MFVEVFSSEILLIFKLQPEYMCFTIILLARCLSCVFSLSVWDLSQFWLCLQIEECSSTYQF